MLGPTAIRDRCDEVARCFDPRIVYLLRDRAGAVLDGPVVVVLAPCRPLLVDVQTGGVVLAFETATDLHAEHVVVGHAQRGPGGSIEFAEVYAGGELSFEPLTIERWLAAAREVTFFDFDRLARSVRSDAELRHHYRTTFLSSEKRRHLGRHDRARTP